MFNQRQENYDYLTDSQAFSKQKYERDHLWSLEQTPGIG